MTVSRTCWWLLAAVPFFVGCAGETHRVALDEETEIERGTGMTSTDFRSITQQMARALVQVPEIQNATSPPTLAMLTPKNNTRDYMDTDAFLNKMRTELIQNAGGKFRFLDRAIVAAIEKENRDKELGRRTTSDTKTPFGADFFLTGVIESIDKRTDRGHTEYIRYSFRLTDAGSSAIVWEKDYEIKKYSRTPLINR